MEVQAVFLILLRIINVRCGDADVADVRKRGREDGVRAGRSHVRGGVAHIADERRCRLARSPQCRRDLFSSDRRAAGRIYLEHDRLDAVIPRGIADALREIFRGRLIRRIVRSRRRIARRHIRNDLSVQFQVRHIARRVLGPEKEPREKSDTCKTRNSPKTLTILHVYKDSISHKPVY